MQELLEDPPDIKKFRRILLVLIIIMIGALVIIGFLLQRKIKTLDQQKQKEIPKEQATNFKKYILREEENKQFPHGEYPKPVEQQPVEIVNARIPEYQSFCPGYLYWKPLVASMFPGQEVENAMVIMSHENETGDPTRVSPTGDIGIFQINLRSHWSKCASSIEEAEVLLKDPVVNTRVALIIFQDQYWYPWTTHHYLGI